MDITGGMEGVSNITSLPQDYSSVQTTDISNTSISTVPVTTPKPTLTPYEEYLFTTVLWTVHYVLDPIVLALGLLGNILAFLVLLQPQYRNQTTCLYMRILAVFDTSIILLKNVQVCVFVIFTI
jgi:hypothetical protein